MSCRGCKPGHADRTQTAPLPRRFERCGLTIPASLPFFTTGHVSLCGAASAWPTYLQIAINRHLKEHNNDPKPFVWTKPANVILAKLDRLPSLPFKSVH